MHYPSICRGHFLSRPNRFTAWVEIAGEPVLCHVKNTGRLRELLVPGAELSLCKADNPARKTPYDVIAVRYEGQWVNIDSQSPNAVFAEYLTQQQENFRREVTHGTSRFDFCIGEDFLIEVKGVTLRQDGLALFPDAPTERAEKHLRELADHAASGHRATAVFIVAIPGCHAVAPHPERASFCQALREAATKGVELWGFACDVTEDSIQIASPLPVIVN